MQREFEEWRNNFAAQQRNSRLAAAKAANDWAAERDRKEIEASQRFTKDTALFQQGQLSSSEYMRRMDAGQYRA